MSVKFEFTLSDQDASNLIDIIQQEICRTRANTMDFIKETMTDTDRANLDWSNRHAEYLTELKEKVLAGNTRIEEKKNVLHAFRVGMLYSAKKYAATPEDRFTGNDVAMFLEMEMCEISENKILEQLEAYEISQYEIPEYKFLTNCAQEGYDVKVVVQ